jgi:hypothetical protein
MNVNLKFDLRCFFSRRVLSVVSLLFALVLVFSCFISTFSGVSPFVLGAPDRVVKNETELRAAINNAQSKTSFIIALDNDISLSSALTIPADKDITLTSNNVTAFYKLIGANGESTIIVETAGSVLRLVGVIVTHHKSGAGPGVAVNSGGMLIMSGGEISGNGVGVAIGGGGVRVYAGGIFNLSGGKIYDNTATVGGGVYIDGTFFMSGGEIFGNTAAAGGGIWINNGNFGLSGGEIFDNSVWNNGGGVYIAYGTLNLSGGRIYNNIAKNDGGGVHNAYGTLSWYDSEIFGNTPLDVYPVGNSDLPDDGGSSNGGDGSSDGNGGASTDSFSLRNAVIICVGVIGVIMVVVVAVLLITSKKNKALKEKNECSLVDG